MVTTHNECKPGYGILVDEESIYVDSEDYYVDGAVVMRNSVDAMRAGSEVITGTIEYDTAGNIIMHDEVNLLLTGDPNVLTGTIEYDTSGAKMHHKEEY